MSATPATGRHRRLPHRLLRHRKRLLGAAAVVLSLIPLAFVHTAGAAAALPPQPGTFTGYGFDACTAPSSASMAAWLKSSPYRAAGIYFGGVNRGCTQANLTPAWVRQQVTAGWRLIPLYVGPQASCTTLTSKRVLIDNRNAAAQGRATADDAAAQARALGLSRESILIYDMEAYRTDDATCRAGVLAFMSAWTARLHDHGYFSGYYSSVSSGIVDQVAVYNKPGYARPDYIDFARWDQVVTTADAKIPDSYWAPKRRMKQYRGGHQETWGGVTINIDNDYLDFAQLPGARQSDFTRNGWSDVLARTAGDLQVWPGNGSYVAGGYRIGTGWSGMNSIIRIGDLNRDGLEDVIARHRNGYLWFYPGAGAGLGARKLLSTGFAGMREITPIGDLNRDGYPDMLAVNTSSGKLFFYPGRSGARFGTATLVARGWNAFSDLTGVNDFNRDGLPDLIARENATGALYLYPGRSAVRLGTRSKVGDIGRFRDLVGVGDFDRDGNPDLAAVHKTNGHLFLLRGNRRVLLPPISLSSGFASRTPLF